MKDRRGFKEVKEYVDKEVGEEKGKDEDKKDEISEAEETKKEG